MSGNKTSHCSAVLCDLDRFTVRYLIKQRQDVSLDLSCSHLSGHMVIVTTSSRFGLNEVGHGTSGSPWSPPSLLTIYKE